MLEDTGCLPTHILSSNVSMENTKCWYRWIFISETYQRHTATHGKNLQNIDLKVLTLILTENSENNLGVYLHL